MRAIEEAEYNYIDGVIGSTGKKINTDDNHYFAMPRISHPRASKTISVMTTFHFDHFVWFRDCILRSDGHSK